MSKVTIGSRGCSTGTVFCGNMFYHTRDSSGYLVKYPIQSLQFQNTLCRFLYNKWNMQQKSMNQKPTTICYAWELTHVSNSAQLVKHLRNVAWSTGHKHNKINTILTDHQNNGRKRDKKQLSLSTNAYILIYIYIHRVAYINAYLDTQRAKNHCTHIYIIWINMYINLPTRASLYHYCRIFPRYYSFYKLYIMMPWYGNASSILGSLSELLAQKAINAELWNFLVVSLKQLLNKQAVGDFRCHNG